MSKFLLFSLLITLVIAGIIYVEADNYLENKIEEAIFSGYPGTESIEVELKGKWLKDGLKGYIQELEIDIKDWAYDNFRINSFKGRFGKIKINLLHLLQKKTIVVEDIENGQIWIVIDEKNINKVAAKYYSGIAVKLGDNDEMAVNLNLSVLGRDFNATIRGTLIAGEGPNLLFKPHKLVLGSLELSPGVQEKILKNMKLKFKLEKIPFTFQVTTVKIMQDKILIEGKV